MLLTAAVTSIVAGSGAVAVTVLAFVDPDPGRHGRGLLVTVAVVAVVAVLTAWVRVASTLAGRPPLGRPPSSGPPRAG
jgi:hypothetical protein